MTSTIEGVAEAQPRLTLRQMAEFIEGLQRRCRGMNGVLSGQTWMNVDRADDEALRQIRAALERMAPCTGAIHRILKQAEADA